MAREMKDSGIAWIGEIPADWQIVKFSRIASIKCNLVAPDDYLELPQISPENIEKGSGKLLSYKTVEESGIISGNHLFHEGQLLYSKIRPKLNKVCIAPFPGLCSADMYPIESKQNIRFLMYCMLSDAFVGQVSMITEDRVKMPKINQDELSSLLLAFPPTRSEQQAIANFLDSKCTEIDAVLNKTRTSIEEYKKLKQAIITQAVTKGVRGERPMKESGIDWADVIPEEIKISRLGLHYDIILGKMLCSAQVDDSYTLEPYYCAADVHFEGISDSERKMMWFSPAEKELYLVQRNDLLVVEGGAGAGGCAVVTDEETPTYIQNSIMIVRAKHSGDCRYVRYWLECLVRQGYIDVVCNKATIPHFTKDKLAAVPYFVFSEQERNEIADYLDEQCRNINSQVEKEECLLHELESYKKSLIYEYVTGKKEVI